ncbi:division cycle 123 protein [Colletotrichum asianum]
MRTPWVDLNQADDEAEVLYLNIQYTRVEPQLGGHLGPQLTNLHRETS